ncbi:MAG: orotate phosphoribosyltransferase [Gemmataceae bacterium]
MSEAEERLLEILKRRSFKGEGPYKLASGGTSDYYIDGKMTEVFSAGAFLIGEVLYERTKDLGIQAIGGLEAGAIPLTTAAVIAYHLKGKPMEGFWVRSKVKDHGTQRHVEGNLEEGSRVVIVDDVVTRGSSAAHAIEEVKKKGCKVVQIISLVDRNAGARELFARCGITEYHPIFTVGDLRNAGLGGTPL